MSIDTVAVDPFHSQKMALIMDLRRGGIDRAIIDIVEAFPREFFVPEPFRSRSYENTALPIANGQTISQPYTVAYMTQALTLGPRLKVLEIGTGSGYQAAILSKLCRRVYSIERYRTLLKEAEARFAALNIHNITTRFGDGSKGWSEQAPFDRIILTAAAAEIPGTLVDQLKDGGIMIAPIGPEAGSQVLIRLTKTADGIKTEELLPIRFVPLVEGIAKDA